MARYARLQDFQFSGENEETWLWCLHCQRCYQIKELRWDSFGVQPCPYQDCDGDSVFDGWNWREKFVPRGYPETPVRGKIYDLYDPAWSEK